MGLGVIIVILTILLISGKPTNPNGEAVTSVSQNEPAFESENVRVGSPHPGSSVAKTFSVVGQARGTWFFEASFPVQVRDPNNNLIGHGVAQASGDWMTNEFVPFTASVIVEGYSGSADLVLVKDNPSGLPEHDDAVLFPIVIE